MRLQYGLTSAKSFKCSAGEHHRKRYSFTAMIRTSMIPMLPSELAAALMAVGVAFAYVQVGLAGVALFGIVLVIFQYLLGALIQSQERARGLRR